MKQKLAELEKAELLLKGSANGLEDVKEQVRRTGVKQKCTTKNTAICGSL